jgi:hypothetical protein
MIDVRTALTVHFRGNFFPPLPLEYVDWAAELLPKMQDAEYEARFGNAEPYDEMVTVPEPVQATRVIPKSAEVRDDGMFVRLGDMVEAMKLHDMVADDED